MRKNRQFNTYWLIGLLAVLSVIGILKGCEHDQHNQTPVAPEGKHAYQLALNVASQPNPNAKAATLIVSAMGVDENGNPIGPKVGPVTITHPTIPMSIPLTLYKPPCRYLITVTARLTRGEERTESTIIDICEGAAGELSLDPYEEPIIGDIQFRAPASAPAGQTITVSCTVKQISAPDSASYPISATLSEQAEDGLSVSGPVAKNSWVSGVFPDPFPVTAAQTQRVFLCSVDDGRSTPKTAQKIVPRVLPTATPRPTATPAPTATVTATPTPAPNLIVAQNDPNASDANTCRSVQAPCRTINAALAKASSGETIFIKAGTYNEVFSLTKNITLQGENRSTVTINSSGDTFTVSPNINLTVQALTIIASGSVIPTPVGTMTGVNVTISGCALACTSPTTDCLRMDALTNLSMSDTTVNLATACRGIYDGGSGTKYLSLSGVTFSGGSNPTLQLPSVMGTIANTTMPYGIVAAVSSLVITNAKIGDGGITGASSLDMTNTTVSSDGVSLYGGSLKGCTVTSLTGAAVRWERDVSISSSRLTAGAGFPVIDGGLGGTASLTITGTTLNGSPALPQRPYAISCFAWGGNSIISGGGNIDNTGKGVDPLCPLTGTFP